MLMTVMIYLAFKKSMFGFLKKSILIQQRAIFFLYDTKLFEIYIPIVRAND